MYNLKCLRLFQVKVIKIRTGKGDLAVLHDRILGKETVKDD